MTRNPSTLNQSRAQPSRSTEHLHNSITDFHSLSQYHMKLARILQEHNQHQCCIILCDWALTSMLKALYMKENNSSFPPRFLSMTDLLHLLHTLRSLPAHFLSVLTILNKLSNLPYRKPLFFI